MQTPACSRPCRHRTPRLRITLTGPPSATAKGTLTYDQPAPDVLILTGQG